MGASARNTTAQNVRRASRAFQSTLKGQNATTPHNARDIPTEYVFEDTYVATGVWHIAKDRNDFPPTTGVYAALREVRAAVQGEQHDFRSDGWSRDWRRACAGGTLCFGAIRDDGEDLGHNTSFKASIDVRPQKREPRVGRAGLQARPRESELRYIYVAKEEQRGVAFDGVNGFYDDLRNLCEVGVA